MDNPLEQPAPDDPIARVHAFARDLAWGAVHEKWGGVFSRWSFDVKDVTDPDKYHHASNELILYIQGKWCSEPPGIDLLMSFEYFTVTQESLAPQGNIRRIGGPSYHLTPKALALLDKPPFPLTEATVNYDYMELAEQLLSGVLPECVHIPAAVLAGTMLEIGLRDLCQRQSPPIETKREDGKHKRLNSLIDALQGKAFKPAKADQLRSWAKIRNSAGHGEVEEFTRADVEDMIAGIKRFLAEYDL